MLNQLDLAAAPPVFDVIPLARAGGPARSSKYTTTAAYQHILTTVMKKFGNLTKWHLAHLLGIEDMSNFNQWFSGRKRMSSLYAIRCIQLMLFHDAGIDFVRIRRIDWGDPVTIHWRNGGKSYPDSVSGSWGEVPTSANPTEPPGANHVKERPRPTATSFKRRPNLPQGQDAYGSD